MESNESKPLKQQIEALLSAAGVGPEGRDQAIRELSAFTGWELNNRLRELTIEVMRLTSQWQVSGEQQGKYAKALVLWTRVLVGVTAVYVLITAGLFLIELTSK